MKNSILLRIAGVLLAVLILAYVGYQAVRYLHDPYQTEIVFRYSIDDSLRASGVVIRSETVLESTSYPGIDYLYKNGERVSKNASVANLYSSRNDTANKQKIFSLQQELAMLEEAQSSADSYFTNSDIINTQIFSQLISFTDIAESGSLQNLESTKNQFLLSLNKRLLATDSTTNLVAHINSVQQELARYSTSYGDADDAIYTPVAGYFSSAVDGYEEILNASDLESLTFDTIQNAINGVNEPFSIDAIGKIITEPIWYFAVVVSEEDSAQFKEGQVVDIVFPFSTVETIEGTVEKIITDNNTGSKAILFETANMSQNLAGIRTGTVQIMFRTFTGLRINENAIRFNENGEQGVYVKSGSQILFKKINIIYEGNGYYLAEYNESDPEYLRLYDELVVGGKDLYDQKPID